MNIEEIATKADLAEMEQRIIQALSAQKVEKERCLDIDEAAKYIKCTLSHGEAFFCHHIARKRCRPVHRLKAVGHKEVTTTQIYTKVLDEGRKKAVELIPKIDV